MRPNRLGLFRATFVVFAVVIGEAGASDKDELRGEIEKDFQKFAAAVKADKFDEFTRWIAPPADRVWIEFVAFRAAVARYDDALDQKLGKDKERQLDQFMGQKGDLAAHFYEVKGEIQGVSPAGKDRAHVVVWTRQPDLRKPSEVVTYERKFTAVKIDKQWKFQLHTISSPVIKKVKRQGPDGKQIDVYAAHDTKGSSKEKDWEEIKKPNSYDGKESDLKVQAATWAKAAGIIRVQTEKVMKGSYSTRKEAYKALAKEEKAAGLR